LWLARRWQVGDLTEADLKGKKVLVRCDLNVPLDGKTITDGTAARPKNPKKHKQPFASPVVPALAPATARALAHQRPHQHLD
jgi:hypothetical protein